MAKLSITIDRFLKKPLLKRHHRVMLPIARRMSAECACRGRCGLQLRRIRIGKCRIRRFELLGEPCSQTDPSQPHVEYGRGTECCLFEKPDAITGVKITDVFVGRTVRSVRFGECGRRRDLYSAARRA